jgi:hypothetical protein
LQLSTPVQVATEPSPMSAAQVPKLVQSNSLSFPVSTLQMPSEPLHLARQLSPHRPSQRSADRHRNSQSSAVQVAWQVSAMPTHVGSHATMSMQSRSQLVRSVQSQPFSSQLTVDALLLHPNEAA